VAKVGESLARKLLDRHALSTGGRLSAVPATR
jgi:hypothetical protein